MLRATPMRGSRTSTAAIRDVEEALKLDPDRVSTYASLGTLQLAQGDQRSAAEETFKQALARHPTSVDAQLAAASYYWAIGQVGEAESLLSKAVAVAPERFAGKPRHGNPVPGDQARRRSRAVSGSAAKLDDAASGRLMLADYYVATWPGQRSRSLARSLPEGVAVISSSARLRLAGIALRSSGSPKRNGFSTKS